MLSFYCDIFILSAVFGIVNMQLNKDVILFDCIFTYYHDLYIIL